MAAAGSKKSSELEEALKPFYERAALAEERLSRLEALLAGKKAIGAEELSSSVEQLKLNTTNAEEISKQEASKGHLAIIEESTELAAGKVKLPAGITDIAATDANKVEEIRKLTAEIARISAGKKKLETENAKLQYQIIHLVRAVREADHKLESEQGKQDKGNQ